MHSIHFNSAVVGAVLVASLFCAATVANASVALPGHTADRAVQPPTSVATLSPGLGTLLGVPWWQRPRRTAGADAVTYAPERPAARG